MSELTTMPAPSLPLTGGELLPALQGGGAVGMLAAMLAQVPRGAILISRATYAADLAATSDADPGAGNVRWDNADPDAAGTLYVSEDDADSGDLSAAWAALAAGGRLYLQRVSTAGIVAQQVWRVDVVTPATGYVKLEVTLQASHGTWTDEDALQLTLQAPATGVADAADVDYDNAVSDLLATTAQAAIDELAAALAKARVQAIQIAVSDEATALTTGTGKVSFRMPYAFTLTAVRASLRDAQPSGSIFTVDINEGGSSILSTKLTIDNTEKTSVTAATAAVISDASLADDAEITIDIDQVGASGAKGLKVALIGYRP